jgi:DNA-binding response OmpR family regulator
MAFHLPLAGSCFEFDYLSLKFPFAAIIIRGEHGPEPMPKHLLLVDDDALLVQSLAYTLEQAGYRTTTAGSAWQGLASIEQDPPDLILLDIGLPDMDGLSMLRRIQKDRETPVIFLTARRRELDELLGLELGAEDYITKPFSEDILLARIKTVLRRSERSETPPPAGALIVAGDLTINPAAHTVTCAGRLVELGPKGFDLLRVLALNSGQVLSVNELLEQVWGAEYVGEPQVVYVHIRWLREKLEEDPSEPRRILTVHGVGYKLVS